MLPFFSPLLFPWPLHHITPPNISITTIPTHDTHTNRTTSTLLPLSAPPFATAGALVPASVGPCPCVGLPPTTLGTGGTVGAVKFATGAIPVPDARIGADVFAV